MDRASELGARLLLPLDVSQTHVPRQRILGDVVAVGNEGHRAYLVGAALCLQAASVILGKVLAVQKEARLALELGRQ